MAQLLPLEGWTHLYLDVLEEDILRLSRNDLGIYASFSLPLLVYRQRMWSWLQRAHRRIVESASIINAAITLTVLFFPEQHSTGWRWMWEGGLWERKQAIYPLIHPLWSILVNSRIKLFMMFHGLQSKYFSFRRFFFRQTRSILLRS